MVEPRDVYQCSESEEPGGVASRGGKHQCGREDVKLVLQGAADDWSLST